MNKNKRLLKKILFAFLLILSICVIQSSETNAKRTSGRGKTVVAGKTKKSGKKGKKRKKSKKSGGKKQAKKRKKSGEKKNKSQKHSGKNNKFRKNNKSRKNNSSGKGDSKESGKKDGRDNSSKDGKKEKTDNKEKPGKPAKTPSIAFSSEDEKYKNIGYMNDYASILSIQQLASVEGKLKVNSENKGVNYRIFVFENMEMDINAFAESFIDTYLPKEENGLYLFIDLTAREWVTKLNGKALDRISDSQLDEIEEPVVRYMKKNDFYNAFVKFSEEAVVHGTIDFDWVSSLIISAIVGLIAAVCVTSGFKSQLKNVHFQKSADEYTRKGSLDIKKSKDMFLYHTVTQRAKQSSSGGRVGRSAGGSHGGHRGRF